MSVSYRWFGEALPGLYGEAPPERGTFFRLQVYERVGILLVELYKRIGKFVILVCKRAQKGLQMSFMAFKSRENAPFLRLIPN